MLLPSKRTALLIALFCALTFVLVIVRRSDEPRLEGRQLTYWVNSYADERQDPRALDALHRIGTNAIPYLVTWLAYEPPPNSAPRFNQKQWQWLQNTFGINVSSLFRDEDLLRANNAVVAFQAIGAQASVAVPGLQQLLKATNAFSARRAARALSEIPGNGVGVLVTGIDDPEKRVRIRCASHLRFARTNDSRVASALIKALKDEDYDVRYIAAESLRFLKVDPRLVVPVLAESLEHADPHHRANAAFQLAQYGTNAWSVEPALVAALRDEDTRVREQAKMALQKLSHEAMRAHR